MYLSQRRSAAATPAARFVISDSCTRIHKTHWHHLLHFHISYQDFVTAQLHHVFFGKHSTDFISVVKGAVGHISIYKYITCKGSRRVEVQN